LWSFFWSFWKVLMATKGERASEFFFLLPPPHSRCLFFFDFQKAHHAFLPAAALAGPAPALRGQEDAGDEGDLIDDDQEQHCSGGEEGGRSKGKEKEREAIDREKKPVLD